MGSAHCATGYHICLFVCLVSHGSQFIIYKYLQHSSSQAITLSGNGGVMFGSLVTEAKLTFDHLQYCSWSLTQDDQADLYRWVGLYFEF